MGLSWVIYGNFERFKQFVLKAEKYFGDKNVEILFQASNYKKKSVSIFK